MIGIFGISFLVLFVILNVIYSYEGVKKIWEIKLIFLMWFSLWFIRNVILLFDNSSVFLNLLLILFCK